MDMALEAADIKALRESLSETMKTFGKRFGVSEGTVSYWESGHSHPRWETMGKLNELRAEQKNGKRKKVTA
jgi:DNA-binding transcriptional regulator YiaG